MQPVYLEHFDNSRNMARFYQVDIQPTLFGAWAVISQWGRIGTHGRSREDWFQSFAEARTAQARRIARKRRRGYDH